ncbi:Alcohol acetyltransferase [Exophiala xenobiotica]|nr:Alcohol acetyltransferase [Exophiala xenobiotica]KAK5270995.1 Alcohol acetyltransferase [Exophiala xenobiotica]KAK5339886.1 Alcohol acetyltransferase [Exophiala xenobiotica]KAK5364323.1 Alcohol acetyltransferase [Exophiala xenobiotica]KAK5399034.1 Alcohol acetyltransferase [Exophiala xenobiotica]
MWFSRSSSPHGGDNYLRAASPGECRCIIRESVGFYRALVVGGIYDFSFPTDLTSIHTFAPALRKCIDRHPLLSATIEGAGTKSPFYQFRPRLDLNQHVQFFQQAAESESESEIHAIKLLLPSILDTKWPPSLPPWKIIILPLSGTRTRCFIGFCFSHALGDGMSAIAFHRTFLDALQDDSVVQESRKQDLMHSQSFRPLSPPFDTKANLPISWTFLLSPLLGVYLPASFGFGLNSITPTTWTGSSTFYDPEKFQVGVQIGSIDAATVRKVLGACRAHGSKITGLIHQLIVAALSELLPEGYDNFAAQTAINMRDAVGVSNDEMGLYVAGEVEILNRTHPSPQTTTTTTPTTTFSWTAPKQMTDKLAAAASRTQDQSVGLLRYLSDIRAWTLSKLNQRRDCSYEVSNLGNFRAAGKCERVSVTEMIFAQSADVNGPALDFNVVSVAEGPMTITITWQIGALDLGAGGRSEESDFVGAVCRKLEHALARIWDVDRL